MQNVTFFKARHNFLKTYFFLSNVRKLSSLNIIRNSILKFIRPSANSVFNSHNSKAITCHKTEACYESLAGKQIHA